MTDVATLIRIAKAEVGYHEGRSGGSWNNKQKYSAAVPGLAWSNGQAWCATFVSWCAMKAGVAALFPRTASTDAGASWFKSRHQWSEYPAVGAQVFYGHSGDMNHTGIVYGYDANYIYTVEGNTNTSGSREGDGVYLKKRLRRDSYVQGYGYPKVPGGLKSADPSYRKPAAPAPSKPAPAPTKPRAERLVRAENDWVGDRTIDVHELERIRMSGAQPAADAIRDNLDTIETAMRNIVLAIQKTP